MNADDILDMIDSALDDFTVSNDAMRWTPEPPRPSRVTAEELERLYRSLEPSRPPTRYPAHPPAIDTEGPPGTRLVPFIGGTRDGSLLRLPADPGHAWNVAEPLELLWSLPGFEEPLGYGHGWGYVTYDVRRIWLSAGPVPEFGLYHRWEGMTYVCVSGRVDDDTVWMALEPAVRNGWRPWRYGDAT